jgi:hypothetical protein
MKRVECAERKAALAERRVVRTARAWFASFGRNSIEGEMERLKRNNRFLFALGLDHAAAIVRRREIKR